jgi:hypothetical protein
VLLQDKNVVDRAGEANCAHLHATDRASAMDVMVMNLGGRSIVDRPYGPSGALTEGRRGHDVS